MKAKKAIKNSRRSDICTQFLKGNAVVIPDGKSKNNKQFVYTVGEERSAIESLAKHLTKKQAISFLEQIACELGVELIPVEPTPKRTYFIIVPQHEDDTVYHVAYTDMPVNSKHGIVSDLNDIYFDNEYAVVDSYDCLEDAMDKCRSFGVKKPHVI